MTSQEARHAEEAAEAVSPPYGGVRVRILEVLAEKFPDRQIPYGGMKAVVEETGASYPWVSAVASQNSYYSINKNGKVRLYGGLGRWAVWDAVEREHPDMVVPWGYGAYLSRKLFITRQRVSQIFSELGVKYEGGR